MQNPYSNFNHIGKWSTSKKKDKGLFRATNKFDILWRKLNEDYQRQTKHSPNMFDLKHAATHIKSTTDSRFYYTI